MVEPRERATAVTVGTFDGVHRGHQAVVEALLEESRVRGLAPVAVTFEPHPLEIVAPGRAPLLIESAREREKMLRAMGVEVVVVDFTPDVRHLTAREWIRRLRDEYGARHLVLGYDNRFGSDGHSLTEEDMVRTGLEEGLGVTVAPAVDGCSSSAIRRAVSEGCVEEAAAMLGRPFSITGNVAHGRELGRTIGVPTANIEPSPRALLPKTGVYAGTAETGGAVYPAVVNVGSRPTVTDAGNVGIEAHLLGFSGDIYGTPVTIRFGRRLRDEMKFPDLTALQARIRADIEEVAKDY